MATCPSCNAEVVGGKRWCGICHANVINPSVGRLASPLKRVIASLLDSIAPIVAVLVFVALSDSSENTGAGALLGGALLVGFVVWSIVLFMRGTTPGKRLLGMRVVREDGRPAGFFTMMVREWPGKWLSGIVLSLGYLWILFDSENQGWHDKLASTYVVE